MNEGVREMRQSEALKAYLNSDMKSILYCSPRFGKIKVAIDIMNSKGYKNPLIVAPRKDIKEGWLSDFRKWKFKGTMEFSTFASIKKMVGTGYLYDFLIIDEPHELSVNQQKLLYPLVQSLPTLGLTGTMTNKTANELYDNLGLDTCYKYTIDQAVREGILADYEMCIHRVPLDNSKYIYTSSKGKRYTEKGYFDLYMFVRKQVKMKHFIDMKLINIIQNSNAKLAKTKQLLEESYRDRILVFCGTTKTADNLNIPVYHSKSKDTEVFSSFCKGEKYDQIATIKMMQAGITISPIHKGIINYTSGNPEDCAQKICRFLGFEYANPDKKAEIHIISTDEEFEIGRLKTALLFFDQTKIKLCVKH